MVIEALKLKKLLLYMEELKILEKIKNIEKNLIMLHQEQLQI